MYTLNPKFYGDVCLSGTAEMALAGYFANSLIEELNMPIRLMAVSRCHRAEASGTQVEKGIYRYYISLILGD